MARNVSLIISLIETKDSDIKLLKIIPRIPLH